MVLTAQAQAQAQAFQAAVNASGAGNRTNPVWSTMQGFPPHMLGAGMSTAYFPHFQAATQQSHETAIAMVGIVKLGCSTKVPSSNSQYVLRSSVRKFDSAGGSITTVGMWCRKVVEENLEWLVKLARRHSPQESAVILAFGDGFELLVLLDDQINKMPKDFATIHKIAVGVSVADIDSQSDEASLAATGVLQAVDSIWEHMSFQQADVIKTKKEKAFFIHTSHTIWSNAMDGRRKVVQVKTEGSKNPHMAVCAAPNAAHEAKVLSAWTLACGGTLSGPTMSSAATSNMPAAVVTPAVAAPTAAASPTETLIDFNPKQLILLEKAFDNGLTPRDLKTDVKKTNAEDKKRCQTVIRRARDEIVTTTKKRRKKAAAGAGGTTTTTTDSASKKPIKGEEANQEDTEEREEEEEEEEEKETPKKESKKKSSKAKKESSEEEEEEDGDDDDDDDSDNEPISSIKASKPKPSKRSSKTSKSKKETPTKKESRKRGRPSSGGSSKKDGKRTRSKSRSKK